MRINASGAELHIRVSGPPDAPIVLLLHAFPLHGGMWAAQMDALARDHRVIAPDFRGFGQSEVGDGQYAIDFFVDDLFSVLDATARHVGEPVAACGLSMGGYVLLRALEREPQRFGAIVLADTKAAADDDAAKLKRLDAVRALREGGVGPYAASFAAGALGPATRNERPDVAARVEAMVRSNPVAGIVGAQLAMAARTDTTAGLGSIAIPTLVVVGSEDAITPPAVAREMAGRIRNARFLELPRAGHLSPIEAPNAFNDAILSFL